MGIEVEERKLGVTLIMFGTDRRPSLVIVVTWFITDVSGSQYRCVGTVTSGVCSFVGLWV